jgi:hypothetical protein
MKRGFTISLEERSCLAAGHERYWLTKERVSGLAKTFGIAVGVLIIKILF